MIDIALLAGRLVLVALLYLFLFAAMRTGIGLVKGQVAGRGAWTVEIVRGPAELLGLKLRVTQPTVVGRSPDSDIVIPAGYVSAHHMQFTPRPGQMVAEDLGSRNGTLLNGHLLANPAPLANGDIVAIGGISIKVGRE